MITEWLPHSGGRCRMKKRLVFLSTIVAAIAVFTVAWISVAPAANAAGGKTGVGLSEHVLKAYQQKWKYQPGCYGQFVNGVRASDCSGLIKSYLWWTGESTNPRAGAIPVAGSSSGILSAASAKGTINYSNSASLPRIHGLILYQPGHVGVYVGNNMAVDNRATGMDMKYEPVFGRSKAKWTMWLKLPQITYPTTGLVTFNGQLYYYENGQYVVSTTRTIDGKQYTFGASGASTSSAPAPKAAASQPSAGKASPAPSSAAKASSVKAAGSKSSPEPSYTELSVNTKSDAVKQLQQRLRDLGYYYEGLNTYYDLCVADAVKAYQTAAKITPTGTADTATQKSLYASSAPKNPDPGTLTPGIHSSRVKNMQSRLIELGYMTGDLSVYYNDATKQAVVTYQKAAGLEPNGIMNSTALDQLYSDSAVKFTASSSGPESKVPSSQAASSEADQVRVYDDMVPKANAATFAKSEPSSNPTVGFALFFVLASGFLTGAFMLVKKFRKTGMKNPMLLFSKLPNIKALISRKAKK